MVKIILEGNKKDIETIKRILDDYVMFSFCRTERSLFGDKDEARQVLKAKLPNEIWND